MKIACVIFGTRGDVQPMVALALGLIDKGHEVTVCAPAEHEQFVKAYDCHFEPFGPEIKKEFRENPEKQKGGVAVKITPAQGKKIFGDQITLLPEKIRGVDLVLAAGIVIGVHTAADVLKIPYRLVAFYPVILGTTEDDPLKNRMMFGMGRKVMNLFLRGFINKNRALTGLPPIKDIWQHWMGDKVIVASDKELSPAREGSAFPFIQTGFMLLQSKMDLSESIINFLNAGKPPVYLGFGSNPIANAGKYSGIFEQVRDTTNQRLIISKGWAEFPESDASDILYVDEIPFELLFPRLAAIIFHGGTGTMAAAARAGVPMAAFPFMGDQFENQKQIVNLGLGPNTCDFKKMTAKSLSEAIIQCVSQDKYRNNAAAISRKLMNSNGIAQTIQYIEKEFAENNQPKGGI